MKFSLTLTLSRREKELLSSELSLRRTHLKVSSEQLNFPKGRSFSLRERVRVRENFITNANLRSAEIKYRATR